MFNRSVLSAGLFLLAIVSCVISFGFQGALTTNTMSNANCITTSNGCGCLISTFPSTPKCLSLGVPGCFITSCNYDDTISITSCQVNFAQNSTCKQSGTNPVTCTNCYDVWCGCADTNGNCGSGVFAGQCSLSGTNDPCLGGSLTQYNNPPSCVQATQPGGP